MGTAGEPATGSLEIFGPRTRSSFVRALFGLSSGFFLAGCFATTGLLYIRPLGVFEGVLSALPDSWCGVAVDRPETCVASVSGLNVVCSIFVFLIYAAGGVVGAVVTGLVFARFQDVHR